MFSDRKVMTYSSNLNGIPPTLKLFQDEEEGSS